MKKTSNLRRLLVSLTLVIVAVFSGLAQKTGMVITGKVTNTSGEPLIGVSVAVKGSSNGVVTDIYGYYTIRAFKDDMLVFSYVGQKSRTIKATGVKLNVELEDNEHQLDQVVVTGYSNTNIRKSTGSVGIVTADQLKDSPTANIDMLLQGKVAGVNVQAVSGRPGESAKIRIRGASSITGDNEPLWVIDGVPLQKDVPAMSSSYIRSGDFSNIFANGVAGINPQSIETITVLKDAAAAAIYGSRASGGVIVVTTKRGKAGSTRVDYSGTVTVQTAPSRSANLMNSQEKLAWEQELWDEFSAPGYASGSYYPVVGIVGQIRSGYGKYAGWTTQQQDSYIESLGRTTTDWFKELFHNSVSTSHSLSISGGTDRLTYYVSGAFSKNDGLVQKTGYDSYNLSAKINANPNDRVSFGVNTSFSYQKSWSPTYNVDIFKYAYFANPYEKAYNADGSYAADETYFSLNKANGGYDSSPDTGFNIFREINENSSVTKSASATVTADIAWRITDDLKFTGLASVSYSNDGSDNINGKNTYAAWVDRPFENDAITSKRTYGSLTQSSSYNLSYMLRAQLNYTKLINNDHRISALVGTEVRSSYAKNIFEKCYGYDDVSGNHSTPVFLPKEDGTIDYDKLVTYKSILNALNGQSITETAFASFYGALDYIYKNRYVANVTARTDGSNNFGSKEQFNATWSFGLAWNIDEEAFMKQLNPVLSSATLRVSTGLTGGVNKSVYPVLIMNYASDFRDFDDGYYLKGYVNNAPNPHLRWERTWDMNASLDLGFFNNRLSLLLSGYSRKGYDLVTPVKVVSSTGFTTQSYNTSEQLNQGFEISANVGIIRRKDLVWNLSANVAYNKNKLTKYQSPTGSVLGDIYVGYPLGKIFSGKVTGINPNTGIYNYELRSDAVITDASDYRKLDNYLFYIGTQNAPWTGGISTFVSYKGISLSVSGSYSLGAKILNNITSPVSYNTISNSSGSTSDHETIPTSQNDLYVNHLNVVKSASYRWTQSDPVTDGNPRIIDYYGQRLYLDRDVPTSSSITAASMLEDVSYFKLASMTLSYSFPSKITKRMRMTNLGLSFTMNNICTISNYSGMNPETPGAVYPMSRSFSIGLNVGF